LNFLEVMLMMRDISLRGVLGLSLLLSTMTTGCRHSTDELVPAQPAAKAASQDETTPSRVDANWPGLAYAEVRAYYHKDPEVLLDTLLQEGAIQKLAANKDGAPLTTDQTKRLLAAVAGNYQSYKKSMCFDPRHAFIFYDEHHKAVAAMEVCFDCYGMYMTPGGMPERIDFPAIADLVDELKLPLHPNGLSPVDFRKLFEASVAARARDKG
jgi:hypothetical protein